MALVDIILYLLSQNSGSAMFALISSAIYFLLTLLQIGLIPICAAAAIFFWVKRIVAGRMDLHTWISLSLIVPALVWALAKIVFLAGEFAV